MKISILGINFYPELTGIGPYTTELCEFLISCGHNVSVFTAFPYYPQWKKPEQYKKKIFHTEDYKGAKLYRSYVFVPKIVTSRTRILHEISFIISSFFNLLFSPATDLIITISPPLGLGLVAYLICKIKRIPFIFHIQDLQPDAAAELGMLNNKILLKMLYKIEKFIYNKAGRVSVITSKMAEKIFSKGIKKEKVLLFPNWIDLDYIKPLERENKFRANYNLQNKFVVLYSGNIGYKQGLDIILDVALKTSDFKDIIYVIAGDGNYKNKLINKLKLNNVIFLPVQPRNILPHMLAASNVCLIPQRKKIKDLVMPSKLLGIMASGRPVIAGAKSDSNLYKVVHESGSGFTTEPENVEQTKEAIMKLYNDNELIKEFGKNGREYCIKNFSSNNTLSKFNKNITEIIKNNLDKKTILS